MSNYIKTPTLPESVADATIDSWRVKEGENFKRDQLLVEIETDKKVLEVRAEKDGKITKIQFYVWLLRAMFCKDKADFSNFDTDFFL